MALHVRFLAQHELIVASVSGAFDLEKVIEMIGRLTKNPEFVWNHDRLVFLKKDVDFSELNVKTLAEIMDARKKAYPEAKGPDTAELSAYRYAVVCNSRINKVMMTLFGAVLESGPVSQAALKNFDSLPDALAWLGRDVIPENEFEEEMQDLQ